MGAKYYELFNTLQYTTTHYNLNNKHKVEVSPF